MQIPARYILIIVSSVVLTGKSVAQTPTDTSKTDSRKLRDVILIESITSVTTLGGLGVLWYSDYPISSFHFINDNKEWLQMDKFGHLAASYNMGREGYSLLRWAGVEGKKDAWYGGATGFAYLTVVEIMDGFSKGWGASAGDEAADALGSALFIGQQLLWDQQKVLLKWSYHESRFPQYRPAILGRNFPERMIKDYNGQTFWLSVNVRSFLRDDSRFPGWLNVALGYSADGMLGGSSNPTEINGTALPYFDRTRKYLLSLDLDMTRIETRSKTLRMILDIIGVLKFPFPAIEYNSKNSWKLHGLYF